MKPPLSNDTKDAHRPPIDIWDSDTISKQQSTCLPGQHFHVDYGFMKGSGYCHKDEEGRTITSIDGYRSNCIIVDKCSRYTWIFLTKTKHPPIQMIENFLDQHGNKSISPRTLRTDKGGELWGSQELKNVIAKTKFLLEPTAPDAPSQNGMAERWSFALLHAVYLKNRIPHSATGDTPYHAYTGTRPSAKYLRIFGSPIIARNPGRRSSKLDMHTSMGTFLGYTAMDKN